MIGESGILDVLFYQNVPETRKACTLFHMILKYTRHFLKKLERVFEDLGYEIHYGKGTFNYGHCLVENEKKVVINKFFDTEGRITSLLEILNSIPIAPDKLSKESERLVKLLIKSSIIIQTTS